MTNQPPPTDPNNEADQQDAVQPTDDVRDYRRVLRDLLEIGAGQARLLRQEALSHTPIPEPIEDPADGPARSSIESIAEAYERISSAVRRTILLAERLADPS